MIKDSGKNQSDALSVVAFAAGLLAPSAAFAAAGSGGPDKAYLFAWINFIIFFVLLIKFLRNPIAQYVASRSEELQSKVEEVRQERAALEQKKAELEAALKEATDNADDKIAAAKEHAEEEGREIIAEARAQADHLIADARKRVDGILQQGQDEAVQHFVAALVKELEQKLAEGDASSIDAVLKQNVIEAVQGANS